MSRNERRYERALAALKAIARTMGNVVFRVEDFRSPRTRSRIGHQDAQRDEQRGGEPRTRRPSPNGPVEMVFDKPLSHHLQFALWLVAYRRSETASVRPKKMARLYDAPMIPSF